MESPPNEWMWRALEWVIAAIGAVLLTVGGWISTVVAKDRGTLYKSVNRIDDLERQVREAGVRIESSTQSLHARLNGIEEEQRHNKEVLIEMATNVRWIRRATEGRNWEDDDSGEDM